MANPFDQFDNPAPVARPGFIPGTPDPYKASAEERAERGEARADRAEARAERAEQRGSQKDPKVTADERGAAGYYRRALNAHRFYGEGVLPRSPLAQTAISALPPDWENSLNSPERRKAQNFADEFIRAKLRKESGAAIPPDEMGQEYRVYFPVPGDTQDDLARKAELRIQAIEALRIAAGSEAGTAVEGLKAPPRQPGAPEPTDLSTFDGGGFNHDTPPAEQGSIGDVFRGAERTEFDAEKARLVDSMVRHGVPYDRALAEFRRRYPDQPAWDPTQYGEAVAYAKEHPEFKGSFGYAERTVPMGIVERGRNYVAQSAPGAFVTRGLNSAMGGIPAALAGDEGRYTIDVMGQQHPYASTAGDIVGGVGGALTAEAAVGRLLPKVSAPVRSLIGDSIYGATSGATSDEDPLVGALKGLGLGALGGYAGRKVMDGVAGTISPTGGKLAPLYDEGVQPTVGQRLGASDSALGRAANRVEQAFGSVPGFGAIQRGARNKAVTQMQTGAFNQALREIDTTLPKGVKSGTQAHAFMQNAFDVAYDKARSGMQFRPDGDFANDFGAVLNDVNLLGADSQRTFAALAKDVGTRMRARGGSLTGDDFKRAVSRLDKKARDIRKNPSGDSELADALESFSAALDNGARRSSPKDAVDLLDKADRGYAKAVIIEDAARRRGGDAGEFSGAQLDAAVQNISGGRRSRQYLAGKANMQDYATAAKALGDTLNDSGTPERIMAAGGVVGAIKLGGPTTMAPWAVNTAANLPGIRQGINKVIAPRGGPKTKAAAQWVRDRSYIGGLFGVPLALEAQ